MLAVLGCAAYPLTLCARQMPCEFHIVNPVSKPSKSIINFLHFHWPLRRRVGGSANKIAKKKE